MANYQGSPASQLQKNFSNTKSTASLSFTYIQELTCHLQEKSPSRCWNGKKKSLLARIKAVQTVEDLEALEIGGLDYEISYRGGYIGFSSANVAEKISKATHSRLDVSLLPRKFGAHCNYLGGGLRGSICASNFDDEIVGKNREHLEALGEACVRVYKNIEDEDHLNDEESPDGDTNWEAKGTNASRAAGIVSAY